VTLRVEDDFAGFVTARWGELVAVAGVACLDPGLAFSVTAESLADLRRRWRWVVEDGVPTREARTALLRAIDRLPTDDDVGGAEPRGAASVPRLGGSWSALETSEVLDSLLDALGEEAPIGRAAAAASVVWGLDAEETAALAGGPPDRRVPELAASRARLIHEHRAALARSDIAPVAGSFERDLAQLVENIAAAQLPPPDPGELVASGARRVPRRLLLAGGGAIAGLGAAGWWMNRGAGAASAGTAGGTAAVRGAGPGVPGASATDPEWASTAHWPVRGGLGGDIGAGQLVAGRSGRLVWADDIGDQRLALAVVSPSSTGSTVRLWSGAAGAAAGLLDPVPLAQERVDGAADVVAAAAPTARGSLLVVLARPTVEVAELSPVVQPTRRGSVERRWLTIPLRGGVGTVALDAPLGPAARVRCGDFDGPPAGSAVVAGPSEGSPSSDEVARLAGAHVSGATGIPVDRLRTRVLVDSPAGGNVIDPYASAPANGSGRVTVTITSTPDGAVVRGVHVRDDAGSGASGRFWGPFTVVAPGDAEAPIVRRVTDLAPKVARFVVVAPGAARARLVVKKPGASSASEVTPVEGGATIAVVVYNVSDASNCHLELWDRAGRRTYSGIPPYGTPLLGLV
jgi:hypothetical protein